MVNKYTLPVANYAKMDISNKKTKVCDLWKKWWYYIAIAFLFLVVYVFSNIQRKTRDEISRHGSEYFAAKFFDQLQISKQQQQNPDMTFPLGIVGVSNHLRSTHSI